MRRVWEWCAKWLPEDQTDRFLVVTVVVSVLLHVLVGVVLIMGGNLEQQRIASKRGEALLVDIAPDKPKETAPLGDPSRHAGPSLPEPPRRAVPPTPPAPKAPSLPPAPAAPRVAEAPKAAPKAPSPAPRSSEPEPASKAVSPAPESEQSQTAKPSPQPQPAQPQPPPPAGMFRRGGGGGLKGGRGGIEGEPIPLDTPEPKFQDYFNQIRERIKSKWIYPYEASSRGIEGELQIEFGIAKSGELQFIEKRHSSGVELLDDYAMRAVQLASPFPPVPDAISKGGLPINGIFRYHILGSGLINNYLR